MKSTLKAVALKAKVFQVRNITQKLGIWSGDIIQGLGVRSPELNAWNAPAAFFILFYKIISY